ncbi:hypothetical protein [Planomonospora alba]|uniref:hypothetical protein n=1 Tax=Planomonospora alba TaxID=161354 RepID=UPI0031E7416B
MDIAEIFEKDEGFLPVISFQTLHDTGSAGSGFLTGEIEPESLAKRRLPRVHSPIMAGSRTLTLRIKRGGLLVGRSAF